MNNDHDSYVAENFDQVLEALTDCGWDAVLDAAVSESYEFMSQALYEAAMKAGEEGNLDNQKVLWLFAEACSMRLSPDKPDEPFSPFWTNRGKRSTIPSDFTESEIAFFSKAVDSVNVPLLKARLADLVWHIQEPRKVDFAIAAIDSYRQVPLNAEAWFIEGEFCLRRAIGLSKMIRQAAGDRVDQIETSLLSEIRSATTDSAFFGLRLADLLMTEGLGYDHSPTVAAQLESLAAAFDASDDFDASREFYCAAARWHNRSGDDSKSADMAFLEGEAWVKLATARVSADNASYGVAAGFLESAVQVYRRIPHVHRDRHQVDERIQETRQKLGEFSKLALEQMMTVSSSPIDLSETIEEAKEAVRDKPIDDALRAFTNLHSINVVQLREAAERTLTSTSFRASIPKVMMSHDGRVIARTPGIQGAAPAEDDKEEIFAEMNLNHYQPLISAAVQALILPATEVLVLEHRLKESLFIELARRSPIVPIGREILFGKALARGFERDYATALHLLTPQIEHMVRFHLKVAGASTTYLDQNGIETENGLSTLMGMPETVKIFGDDISYEIKALFCDQLGPNLRNNIAHGLLNDQQCYTIDAIYAWWLGLKLVYNSFWNTYNVVADAAAAEDAQNQFSTNLKRCLRLLKGLINRITGDA